MYTFTLFDIRKNFEGLLIIQIMQTGTNMTRNLNSIAKAALETGKALMSN